MKTPIQELIEHFNDAWSGPGDLWSPSKVISKLESMLEKEKQVMCDFADDCVEYADVDVNHWAISDLFDKTFNAKEK